MAEEIKEKLVLKPGVVSTFLTNFSRTADLENMQFVDLIMNDKMVDAINAKSMEEAKDVQIMDFSINAISDVSTLKDCSQLIKLNLSKNKIKSLAVFTSDDVFPNLKWLDVSHNKIARVDPAQLGDLPELQVSQPVCFTTLGE